MFATNNTIIRSMPVDKTLEMVVKTKSYSTLELEVYNNGWLDVIH